MDSDIVLDDGEESQYLAGIKIDVDDLIIDGNGYAISAERKTRIFEVTGKNITIENIILKNGFAKKDGGAIYNCGGELSVSGTTLTENTARRGGAISNNEGLLTVSDSSLTGNKLRNIYTGKLGGAIFNSGGNLTVYDSIFTENTAGLGGAIFNGNGEYIIRDDPPGIFSRPLFNGGGGELMIFDSIFTENTAAGGGAIFNSGGELTVSDSELAGNTARDSYGGGIGGAIFNDCGTFTVSDSVLTGNEVQDSYMVGRGGAIFHLRGNFKVLIVIFQTINLQIVLLRMMIHYKFLTVILKVIMPQILFLIGVICLIWAFPKGNLKTMILMNPLFIILESHAPLKILFLKTRFLII